MSPDELRGLRDALEAAQGELRQARRALEGASGEASAARAEAQRLAVEGQHLRARVAHLEADAATAWATQRRGDARWPALEVDCRLFHQFDEAAVFASALAAGALRTISWDAALGVVGVWHVVGVRGPPREVKCEFFTALEDRADEVHDAAARFVSRLPPEALVTINGISEAAKTDLAVWYFAAA